MIAQTVMRFADPTVRADLLPRIARGEILCSLGFSEPGAGSDVFAARTRATRDADSGDWIVDGAKMFTSGADIGDYVMLLARTDPAAAKHRGLTLFLVPLDAPGVEVRRIETFQDEPTTATFYTAVRVPDRFRLGAIDGGVNVMSEALEIEQGGGGGFFRAHRHLLDAATRWAWQAPRGDGVAAEDPDVQSRLAAAAARVSISELLYLRSLWARVEKVPLPVHGSITKLCSSEYFVRDAGDLIDLVAPDSLDDRLGDGHDINLAARHAVATTIYGGTSEIHRSMIAERVLHLPRTRS